MGKSKTIGVILSGAGHLDGAELRESVLALLALDRGGATVRIFAPKGTLQEVDHLTGKATGQTRDVLTEAARVARGDIADLAEVQGTDVDGWVIPGGFGAAKNLSNFAEKGSNATAHREVTRVVREALAAHIPLGACCIAPALLAVVTKNSGPHLTLTVGEAGDVAKALGSMGATHQVAAVTDVVTDEKYRVVTTPAYMYDNPSLAEVSTGIEKMVAQVLDWVD